MTRPSPSAEAVLTRLAAAKAQPARYQFRASDLRIDATRGWLVLTALALHESRDALVGMATACAPVVAWIAEQLA